MDGWTAPPQARFERLLRETGVPAGLLCAPDAVRLVHAPKGETSGHITFRVADMATVMGRPILSAFQELLGAYRLFRAPERERLATLLTASREAQNTVSTKLAQQVRGALYELLRGFIAADARDPAHRFSTLVRTRPDDGLRRPVTALMRLVFILYAEDRDLMPRDPVYEQSYGLRGLFAKLREDHCGWLVMCPDFVAHDLSGFWNCSKEGFRRLGIGMQPKVRMARLLDAVARYRAGRLSCVQAAELVGDERAALPSSARSLRGGRRRRVDRSPARAGIGPRAPVDQLAWVIEQYRTRYWDFTVKISTSGCARNTASRWVIRGRGGCCIGRGWSRRRATAERIASGGRVGRCRG